MFGRIDTLDRPRHKLLTVELCNVMREYRVGGQSVRALDEINLGLEGGQFAAIVGPSGAGKSTLLHLLGALDSPDSGSIMFDGQEIGRLSDEQQSAFRHHRVGFIFQFFNLCRPCRRGRTWRSPSCSTVSGWARPKPMRFGSWTGSGSATGPSTDRRSCPAAKCSGSPWPAH